MCSEASFVCHSFRGSESVMQDCASKTVLLGALLAYVKKS